MSARTFLKKGVQALEKTKKASFWKRMIMSIKDFESYPVFAMENASKAIQYFITLVAIFTLVITITTSIKFTNAMESTISQIDAQIEDFTLKDGTLTITQTEPILLKENEVIGSIIIDTTIQDKNEQLAKLEEQKDGIRITQDTMYIKNATTGAFVAYSLKDVAQSLGIQEITKADMMQFFESGKIYTIYIPLYILVYLYLFLLYLSTTAIDLLILATLGYLTARIIGIRMRFSATCKMAAYALTLPILLNMAYVIVNAFTGFTIDYFQIMYTAISYIYMITAILLIKSDTMRQKMELAKVIEEQKKVHEELENEPEKPEKEKKKEEKKDKKEEEKEGTIGEQPEGNQA